MRPHVCPWWGGYFIDNRLRRLLHNPERIVGPYIEPGITALDFGCGMGLFAIAMAQLVGDDGCVIAADLQPQMLDVLSKRAEKAGVRSRVRTHVCQSTVVGLQEPLDFALAFYSAHEVPSVAKLLTEIHACLRPGGRFLLVEPIGHVSAAAFGRMVAMAEEIGLVSQGRPRVRLSRAAVLGKPR